MVSLFDSITPKEMAEFQRQDNQIAPIFTHVEQDQKPSKKVTYQIRSKLALKLALQWDRLILKQGVLHRLYIFNEMEYHQLVLPQRYHRKVFTALHDHMGHQGISSSSLGFHLQCYTSRFNRLSTIPTYVWLSCSGTL